MGKRYINIKRILTTYNGANAQTIEETEKMQPYDGTESDIVNIYPQMKYQQIKGFGGAITETAGYVLSKMDDKSKQEFLSSYYGQDGNGYRFAG